MLISVVIESEEAGNTLALESSASAGKVKITAASESIEVDGMQFDRGITNALNVGTEPPINYAVQTTISVPEINKFLVIENHSSDRNMVIVKVGSEGRRVNGRNLSTAIRHCL